MIDLNIIDISGWLGSICYATYTIPQAIYTYKQGKTETMSTGMIILLFFGCLCSTIYMLPDFSSPLLYNFSISLISTSVILKYHFLPRK